ncbi:phosphomannose isomerase type II C-terminal cupin domain [Candidatus Pacearchaeota archaeon]|nr:phosphomannose isomerase type II C-terminal cupin domain [Candidatus Pacearchaeota archaeon]
MKKKVVNKPWGFEEQFTLNEISSVKILYVKPGRKLSLQKHKNRSEFWKVLESVKVWIGNKKIEAIKGDEFMIKKGQLHRLEGLKKTGSVLEISFGKFDENDIERIEDDYGRVK